MAGEVTLRATLARPYLAATTTPQLAYALIEVQPTEVVAQVRMPVNVCFVLDRSGSMKGEKIEPIMKELSEDGGSAAAGTDYECSPTAQLVEPFKNLGLRLKVGEVGAVKTQFGIHIIQRTE